MFVRFCCILFGFLFVVFLVDANSTLSERQTIANKVREGFLTVALKDLLALPRLLKRIPEITTFEQAHSVVAQASQPLALIIEALGQENRLDRLEKMQHLTADTKLFFQKLEDQKKESVRHAVSLYELQNEAVKQNIKQVYPITAHFFEEHSKTPKTSIMDLFPIQLNDADDFVNILDQSMTNNL